MGNSESIQQAAIDVVKAEGERRAREAVKDTAGWVIDNASSWSLTAGAAFAIAFVVFGIFIAYNTARLLYANFKSVIYQIAFGLALASITFVVVMAVEWVFILWWGWS